MSVVSGGLQSGGGAAVLLLPSATGSTLTLSGSLTIPAGTAAAPTLNFTGDTTTGLYRAAASKVGIAGAGVGLASFEIGGASTGVIIRGLGSNASLTLDGQAGCQLKFSTTTLTFSNAGIAFAPSGVNLGGFTVLGSLFSGPTAIPDASGTPGNATQNAPRGRAAFAAAATTCVITNSEVDANSVVMVVLETANDATLLYVRGVVPAAGSFTVTANAAATGTVIFRWFIVKSV